MRIQELFDTPASWQLKSHNSDLLVYTADVKGKTLTVEYVKWGRENAWEVAFDINGSAVKTGAGNEIETFSTVLDTMKDFVKRVEPLKIKFDAAKGEEDGESREKLYNRLVARFAAAHGYRLASKQEKTIGSVTLVTYELDRVQDRETATVNELFDRPEKLDRTQDSEDRVRWDGFVGGDQLVILARETRNDTWRVEFRVGGRQDLRGDKKGLEVSIFSTVINTLQEFVRERSPDRVMFTAEKSDSGQETGRSSLYTRMVKRFAHKLGYDAEVLEESDKTLFLLTQRD